MGGSFRDKGGIIENDRKFNSGCSIIAGGWWRSLAMAIGKTSRWAAFLGVCLQPNVD